MRVFGMRRVGDLIAITLGIATAAFAVACNDVAAVETRASNSAASVANTAQARFKIEGMTCGSCNLAVKMAAEKVDGVSKAGASHKTKQAWAAYDPAKTNPKVIAKAITAAGYRATIVTDS